MLHSAAPSQEAAGGLNKRSHPRDNREMAIRGKGNYGLTGELRHKASSLYTTTCGYVEQTQSKMRTMTTHHMIGSSVACDGEQGKRVAMDQEDEVQSHQNRNQFKGETEKYRDEIQTRHETRTNQKQKAKHMHRPWQSKEVGC